MSIAESRPLSRRSALATTALLLLMGCGGLVCSTRGDVRTIPLAIGGHQLEVELALTSAEHAQGLMYRKELGADAGMLFVFEGDSERNFWMKNTFLPLSIAFIDRDRKIVNMADMVPLQTTETYASQGPVRYVLEVNQGWFARHGIKAGAVVEFTLPEAERR